MDTNLAAAFLARPEVRNWIKVALESQYLMAQRKLRKEEPGSDVHNIRRRECAEIRAISVELEGLING